MTPTRGWTPEELIARAAAQRPLYVDRRREGLSALGWFALDRSPLAFLRDVERRLFCSASLAGYLPDAIALRDVLARLP